jgi:hypothetical protein
VKATTWSALAAWVALAIGIANLWYTVLRHWWRERKARPAAELELLNYQSKSGMNEEVRLVVTNLGPAKMKAVEVQVFDDAGTSLEVTEPSVSSLWPKMPVQWLHAGQTIYLTLNRSAATKQAKGTLIRWHDGRKAQQSEWIWLSYHRRF